MNNKKRVIVVVGPTASGKTGLAIEIAKKLNGEIISADSMQIYKTMDIATAKPTARERSEVKHHLIDFVEPNAQFSVAMYKEKALKTIENIINDEKLPILVGGTGLYVDMVVDNTQLLEYCDNSIREKLLKKADELGIETLYDQLYKVDKQCAEKLHINDKKRIIRALEVYYTTGKTISEQNALSHQIESPYEFCIIGLTAQDRQFLYDRINKRVDIMLEEGLVEEAKQFFSSDISKTAKQAIGYKELYPYLCGEISLQEAVDKLKMQTRRYAKRQLTWFRKNNQIHWINIDTESDIVSKALQIIKETQVSEDE